MTRLSLWALALSLCAAAGCSRDSGEPAPQQKPAVERPAPKEAVQRNPVSVDFATSYCHAELYVNGALVQALDSSNTSRRIEGPVNPGTNKYLVKVLSLAEAPKNMTLFPQVHLQFYTYKGKEVVRLTQELKFDPRKPQEYSGEFSY